MVEDGLADAQGVGRDFEKLVIGEELKALLKAHLAGRHKAQGFVGAGGAHIGQLLFLADVDGHVLIAVAQANNHAGVDLGAGSDEHGATLLGSAQAVGNGFTGFMGNEGTYQTALNLTLHGCVAELKQGTVDAVAADIGVAAYQMANNKGDYVMLDEAISSEQYAVGFLLGNTELRDAVNAELKKMADDGTMMKIAQDYVDVGLVLDNLCMCN